MKKLIRKAGVAGAATATAAGVLLIGVGPAAAAPGSTGHTTAGATVVPSRHAQHHHRGLQCIDPWVAGQLAWFDPAARHRLAVFDPWIKDQLARYAAPNC